MKTYYAECEISFTDKSEKPYWKSSEGYSFIINAENKKEGKADAENKAKEELKLQLGNMDDINVAIHQFYETSDDARAN